MHIVKMHLSLHLDEALSTKAFTWMRHSQQKPSLGWGTLYKASRSWGINKLLSSRYGEELLSGMSETFYLTDISLKPLYFHGKLYNLHYDNITTKSPLRWSKQSPLIFWGIDKVLAFLEANHSSLHLDGARSSPHIFRGNYKIFV